MLCVSGLCVSLLRVSSFAFQGFAFQASRFRLRVSGSLRGGTTKQQGFAFRFRVSMLCASELSVSGFQSSQSLPADAVRQEQSTIGLPQSLIPNPQSTFRNPQSAFLNPQSAFRNPQSDIRHPTSHIQHPTSLLLPNPNQALAHFKQFAFFAFDDTGRIFSQ